MSSFFQALQEATGTMLALVIEIDVAEERGQIEGVRFRRSICHPAMEPHGASRVSRIQASFQPPMVPDDSRPGVLQIKKCRKHGPCDVYKSIERKVRDSVTLYVFELINRLISQSDVSRVAHVIEI